MIAPTFHPLTLTTDSKLIIFSTTLKLPTVIKKVVVPLDLHESRLISA